MKLFEVKVNGLPEWYGERYSDEAAIEAYHAAADNYPGSMVTLYCDGMPIRTKMGK